LKKDREKSKEKRVKEIDFFQRLLILIFMLAEFKGGRGTFPSPLSLFFFGVSRQQTSGVKMIVWFKQPMTLSVSHSFPLH
jgi:hypothetical protein